MGLEDNFLGLKDAIDHDDTNRTIFPAMPRYTIQESSFGGLYRDNGPWITQNMDAQPPPKDAHFAPVTQSLSFEFARWSNSRDPTLPTTRVKLPLPSIRQRTAQACDNCRERKTKCSGHRPVCLRCMTRGLICEYSARETRLRLPTQSRFHPGHIRPVSDHMQQVYYQPTIATRSRLGNNPLLVGFCEPEPVYLGHPTMAFSNGRYVDWDGYQQGSLVYGDSTTVAPYDTRLSLPFQVNSTDSSKY